MPASGSAEIRFVGGALPKLTERGLVGEEDFPLTRHPHAIVALDEPAGKRVSQSKEQRYG